MRAIRVCTATLLLVWAGAPDVLAARLPAWADAIAETAPELPAGVSKQGQRVLLHERTIVIGVDGTMKETLRIANQSLSQTNGEAGLESMWFSRNTKIKSSKAWHLPPKGGTEKATASDSLDFTLDPSFLTDKKTRLIGFPNMKRGSLVFFEFETSTQPFAQGFSEVFVGSGAIDRHLVDLTVPPGWDVIFDWLAAPGPQPRVSGSRYVWELRDIVPQDREDELAASVVDRAPRLVVSVVPPENASTEVPGFRTWADLAAWYQNKSSGLTALTKLPSALDGAGAPSPAIRSARFVRDQVRYVAKEVGIGGYIPRSAKETSETLWGDCKDKATLLTALLASQQIESYPVLVNATLRNTVSETVPSLSAFDHMVSAVRVDDALAPELTGSPALFEAPTLGRLMLIDVTDETSAVGSVSASLAGKRALIVAPQASVLVMLPGKQSSAHRVERELTVTIEPNGGATFDRETRYYGEPGGTARGLQRASPSERQKSVLKGVRDTWVDAEPAGYEVELETKDGAMREVFKWTVKELPRSNELRIVPIFDDVRAWLPAVSLSKRKIPIVYEYPLSLNFRATVKRIPAGTTAPETKSLAGDGWSVKTEYKVDGDSLIGTFQLTLDKTEFAPSEFDNLKKLNSAIGSIGGGIFL